MHLSKVTYAAWIIKALSLQWTERTKSCTNRKWRRKTIPPSRNPNTTTHKVVAGPQPEGAVLLQQALQEVPRRGGGPVAHHQRLVQDVVVHLVRVPAVEGRLRTPGRGRRRRRERGHMAGWWASGEWAVCFVTFRVKLFRCQHSGTTCNREKLVKE